MYIYEKANLKQRRGHMAKKKEEKWRWSLVSKQGPSLKKPQVGESFILLLYIRVIRDGDPFNDCPTKQILRDLHFICVMYFLFAEE